MANNTVRTPWIIDTAHATDSIAPYANTPVLVESFVFSGYLGAGDRCIVEDSRGVVVTLQGDATFEAKSITFSCPKPLLGLKVVELGSGILNVYIA